jgi:RNA polymerase sigma-70 factor (ECF subfamily)
MTLVENDRSTSIHAPSAASAAAAPLESVLEADRALVQRALRALGVPPRDLCDVTHDVFVIAAVHQARYDPSRPRRPWLLGIARRAAADYAGLARHRRERFTEEGCPDGRDDRPSAQEALESREAQRLVAEALAALADDHRAVLVMHDVEELRMPQIAADLAIPLSTGYSRLRLARAALKAAVEHRTREGDGMTWRR